MPVEIDGIPRFFGGAVGYLGYDVVAHLEDFGHALVSERERRRKRRFAGQDQRIEVARGDSERADERRPV